MCTRQFKNGTCIFLVLIVGLVAGADQALAAGKAGHLPGFGTRDGMQGGYGGRGGTKTGDYNDSSDPNAAAAAEHDSLKNDPNAGVNKGVKDETAAAAAAIDAAQKKVERQFESTPEWTDAADAFNKAKEAMSKARFAVLAALKQKPAYQSAVAAAEKAAADLSELHKGGGATPEQLSAAATTGLRAQSAVTKMENDAFAADPAMSALKPKVTESTTAMMELRKKEHVAVLADADYQAAKQRYDAVRGNSTSVKKSNKSSATQPS